MTYFPTLKSGHLTKQDSFHSSVMSVSMQLHMYHNKHSLSLFYLCVCYYCAVCGVQEVQTAERTRRTAESERDELQDELHSASSKS